MKQIKFKSITWREYQEYTKNPDPAVKAVCELYKKFMDSKKK